MTIDLTDAELRMIISALRSHEDGGNCGTEEDEIYFSRVLALVSRLEAEVQS